MHPILLDTTTDPSAGVGLVLGLLMVAAFYFLPSIIAITRKLYSVGPVIIINTFLGWTFIGWVAALAMAFGETKNDLIARQTIQVFPASPAAPAAAPQYSPDGRYWWDGVSWRSVPSRSEVAPSASGPVTS